MAIYKTKNNLTDIYYKKDIVNEINEYLFFWDYEDDDSYYYDKFEYITTDLILDYVLISRTTNGISHFTKPKANYKMIDMNSIYSKEVYRNIKINEILSSEFDDISLNANVLSNYMKNNLINEV